MNGAAGPEGLVGLVALVRDWAEGRSSTGVALIRLLAQTRDVSAGCRALESLRDGPQAGAARRLQDSLERSAAAGRAARLLERARDLDVAGGDPVARAREFFDWAVGEDPELAVAAYALEGRAALDAATGEVVARIAASGALSGRPPALDLGCGIGRMARALASRCESVTGVDVSSAMVARARAACAGLPNVAFLQHDGQGLAGFPASRFDLVVAVDVFPYLVQQRSAAWHVEEIARVLRAPGHVFVFNWSYRGDEAEDRREARSAFERSGLQVLACGERPLRSWDALVFHARRPAPGRGHARSPPK